MERDRTDRALDSLVVIADISASEVADESTVIVTMVGEGPADTDPSDDYGDDEEVEQVPDCELWSSANFLYRPLPPTAEGAPEGLCLRIGDTREVIATKDRRWQPPLEPGEVIVRNLIEDALKRALIHIDEEGQIVLDAVKVCIGDASATEKIALGTALKSHLDAVKSFLDLVRTHLLNHTHPVSGAVAGATTVSPFAGTVPTVPDVESRHTVEN